jgi:Sulfotransferase domain
MRRRNQEDVMTYTGDGQGPEGLPGFVVIGAQKSASTFLQDQMAQHPDIELADGEVRCFEDPFYSPEAVAALPGLFRRPAEGVLRGIKRPDYLSRPEVAGHLHRHLPDAKLIAVIRRPVGRAVSAYYHYVRHGFVPLLPVDDAFRALLAGELQARYPRSREILDYGLYGEHLARYLEHFPAEQLLVFDMKTLADDPAGAVRRAFEFVGVDPAFVPDTNTSRTTHGVYSARRLRVLRTKNRILFDYTPEMDLRHPRRPGPVGWLWNASVVAVDRTLLSRLDGGHAPALAGDVRAATEEFYRRDQTLLREVLAGLRVEVSWLT